MSSFLLRSIQVYLSVRPMNLILAAMNLVPSFSFHLQHSLPYISVGKAA
jgi:hypothetical protein